MTNVTKSVTEVSPSMFRTASRCLYAAALSRIKDPNGKQKYPPLFGKDTKDLMNKGRYFEECLLKQPYVCRDEEERDEYDNFRNSSRRKVTLARIEQFADRCRPAFKLDECKTGQWLSYDFPEFRLRGVLDYVGRMAGLAGKFITDIKYTGSIMKVWDIGGEYNHDLLLQIPMYALLHALKSSTAPDLFLQACNSDDPEEAYQLLEKWEESTEIPNGMYFVCEHSDVPAKIDPMLLTVPMQIDAEGLMLLYKWMRKVTDSPGGIKQLMVFAYTNKYNEELSTTINPDEYKCLGKGRKGKCPYLTYCPYGRRLIERPIPIKLTSLMHGI